MEEIVDEGLVRYEKDIDLLQIHHHYPFRYDILERHLKLDRTPFSDPTLVEVVNLARTTHGFSFYLKDRKRQIICMDNSPLQHALTDSLCELSTNSLESLQEDTSIEIVFSKNEIRSFDAFLGPIPTAETWLHMDRETSLLLHLRVQDYKKLTVTGLNFSGTTLLVVTKCNDGEVFTREYEVRLPNILLTLLKKMMVTGWSSLIGCQVQVQ